MPRGVRETQFYVVEETRTRKKIKSPKPTVRTFQSTPEFKEWVIEAGLNLAKQTKDVIWLDFPDGRWALAFKGYNLACMNGKVLT